MPKTAGAGVEGAFHASLYGRHPSVVPWFRTGTVLRLCG